MNSKIARRYSTALYEEAVARSILDKVAVDAMTVIDSIDESRELFLFFKSPIIDKAKKQEIVKEIFEGKINALSLHLILLLILRGREAETRNVFEDFLDLKNNKEGILKADVVTAVELNAEEKNNIKNKIDQFSKLNSQPTFRVDSSLVGGFKIKVNDTILDASITRQLELLSKKFKEGDISLN